MTKLRLRAGKYLFLINSQTLTFGSRTLHQQDLSLGPPCIAHNAPVMVGFIPLLSPGGKWKISNLLKAQQAE